MWSDKYLGKPYTRRYNCAALAADVAINELGVNAKIPRNLTASPEEQMQLIKQHLHDYVSQCDKPEDKQVVLLIGRGVPCHVGVMCLIDGSWWVLHADSGFGGVIRQRLRDVEKEWKVEGWYKWNN